MRIWLVAIVALGLVAAAFLFLEPAPPSRFTLATGAADGAYAGFADGYARALARKGVTVELRETAGAVENLALLGDPESDVEVGFVQGGLADGDAEDATASGLVALGALYFEPVWLFRSESLACEQIRDLAGARVAIGEPGSGTRAVAVALLGRNGIGAGEATLVESGGLAAADALIAGELDALLHVGAAASDLVQRLFRAEGVDVVSLERAAAYQVRDRHYARLVLPRGGIDLAADLPDRDVTLIAVGAMLVARSTFHPALIERLLEAAREVHVRGGIFEQPGEFPAAAPVDWPLSEHALQYYESGLGFLSRVLPFWAASLVKRLLVLMIPLVGILLPLSKIVPALYQWRIRSRLTRRYKALLALDAESDGLAPDDVQARLDEIVREVDGIQVPPAYASALYDLRFHIERVRRRLAGQALES